MLRLATGFDHDHSRITANRGHHRRPRPVRRAWSGGVVASVSSGYAKIAFPLAATSSRAAFGGYAPDYAISDPGQFFGYPSPTKQR